MAEDKDESDKTEEPTQKRLDEARERGDVPRSIEIKHAAMVGSGALVATFLAGGAGIQLQRLLASMVETMSTRPLDPETAQDWAGATVAALGLILGPVFALFVAAAIGAGLIQGRPTVSWERLAPKWSKVSPASGFKRLFSGNALVEFLKTLAKLGIVGTVCLVVIWPNANRLEQTLLYPLEDTLRLIRGMAVKLLLAVAAIVTALALADFFYQRLSFLKRMRMSRQELRDEHKQSEGDPMIKARIRQIRLERARRRMMAAVPEADVVITNPTHFAVALKYDHDSMAAPRLVAKGVDTVAFKIREIATAHNVPIVENPPLARSLHATVDLDEEIPPEQYRAVAEVISYVMKLKGRLPARRPD